MSGQWLYACAVGAWGELLLFDISRPASPTFVTNVVSGGWGTFRDLQAASNRLYSVNGEFGYDYPYGWLSIYDIGNGPFNHALGENFDITWIIYNNEGYMNTGMQKSGATRFGSDRSTSPIGTKFAGKTTLHRRLISQAMAISHVYAAKLTIDNPMYAIKILKEAIAYNGPSMVEFFALCPQGHQSHDWF